MGNSATFEYERKFWDEQISSVAGIDEVGMGAWAGPVTAAAVIFRRGKIQDTRYKIQNDGVSIRDSKTLSVKQREQGAEWIKQHAQAWAVGEASVEEISTLNIRQASHLAMQRAVDALEVMPELLLVDGTPVQVHSTIPSVSVIDGDAKSVSIAAASIVAKVFRDALMVQLDKQYPGYGLAAHKGYGTQVHRAALKELGVTPHHRPTYAPVAALLS